eukprot:TRINITY_DN18980_c0_g1_i1.p3 TRINITY_DN18980_c0_g1~~TRINITY_DN18980_c0_g1_i1.p3  ORF type:complete len:102 (+),score=21.09 TRINITY_DN18980_c0_g1_i1:181-486(+)
MEEEREFRFIVFGATGFTGERVVSYLRRKFAHTHPATQPSWAIAGRSKDKLAQLATTPSAESAELTGHAPSVVVADIEDESSLQRMTSRCSLLLNLSLIHI